MSTQENVQTVKNFLAALGLLDGREPQALTHRDRYRTKRFAESTNTLNSGNAF